MQYKVIIAQNKSGRFEPLSASLKGVFYSICARLTSIMAAKHCSMHFGCA